LKSYLITGASRGLGAELARKLLDSGCQVIGLARSPIDAWTIPGSENFIQFQCDLTDESMVKRTFSNIRKSALPIDVLINNAGIFSSQLLQTTTSAHISAVLNSNLLSALYVTREAAKIMRSNGGGSVISISSIATTIRIPGNSIYGISKLGLEELMCGFATELKDSGITFNSIRVSLVENTGMVSSLSDTPKQIYESRLFSPGVLTVSEVVHAVQFFQSNLAKSITGQVLTLGSPN
jgi:NAD(P)-dependent dehydrogenase (short-subunit alcohol dehydrogenase family)